MVYCPGMMPLLPVRSFAALSWQRYTQHFGRFLETSLWLLIPSLFQLAFLFLLTIPSVTLELNTVWTLNLFITRIMTIVLGTWVSVRLMKLALAQDPKEEKYIATHPHLGWGLFFPALWINILFGLAVFGGTVALVIPGIWLLVALSFGSYVLIDQDVRGLRALDISYHLVRHRWWPVLGRLMVAGLSFFVLSFLLLTVLSLVLDLIFGGSMTTQVAQLARSLSIDHVLSVSTLRGYGIDQLKQALLTCLTTPFLAISQALLYKSLKETYRPEDNKAA